MSIKALTPKELDTRSNETLKRYIAQLQAELTLIYEARIAVQDKNPDCAMLKRQAD